MRTLLVGVAAVALTVGSGGAPTPRSSVTGAAAQASAGQASKTAAGKQAISPDALDKLLAPIALYPDQLLAQILLGATKPGKLAALAEWTASHQSLKGSELQDAASKAGFDPELVVLLLFPQVLDAMVGNLERTTSVGEAFSADRSAVFASIQRLRSKAKAAGTLKSTPQQTVETRTVESGQQVIVIEPANPQVVYVPQYNPQVVYTQPTSTTVVIDDRSSSSDAVAAGVIGFTAGIALGAAFDNDYYYGPYGWRGGVYMYDDAWDDWADAREDAREDWTDHREDIVEERGDRAGNAQEQRTERTETRQENRPETQAQREQRRTDAQAAAGQARTGTTSSTATSTQAERGYSRDGTKTERSGTRSDAFSNYSSGRSERAASQRGQRSRSSSGGGRRR